MDGSEFLSVAETLLDQKGMFATDPLNKEALVRTAISRAYYGAYNYARSVLRELGFRKVADSGTHGDVWNYLRNCSYEDVEVAGEMLKNLHAARKGADYDLHKARFSQMRKARQSLDDAKDIVTELEECCRNTVADKVRRGLQDYQNLICG